MLFEERLNWSDEQKAKRSLLSASIATIIFSNLTFTSSTFEIFGLVANFDPEITRHFARAGCSLLLAIFILRAFPPKFRSFVDTYAQKLDLGVNEIEAGYHEGEDERWRKPHIEEARLAKIAMERRYSLLETSCKLVVDNMVPILLAIVAIIASS